MAGPSKLNESKIGARVPTLSDLFFFANPITGKGSKNTLQSFVTLLSSLFSAPVTIYTDIPEMLANTAIQPNYFAFVIDGDETGEGEGEGENYALYLYLGGDRSLIESYKLIGAFGNTSVQYFLGYFTSLSALTTAHPTASEGNYAYVDLGVGEDVQKYIWDSSDNAWVLGGGGGVIEAADQTETNAGTESSKYLAPSTHAGYHRRGRQVSEADSIVQTDQDGIIWFNSATPFNFTLDELLINTAVRLVNLGTATVTLINGTGVALEGGNTILSGKSATVFYKTTTTPHVFAPDSLVFGDLGDFLTGADVTKVYNAQTLNQGVMIMGFIFND